MIDGDYPAMPLCGIVGIDFDSSAGHIHAGLNDEIWRSPDMPVMMTKKAARELVDSLPERSTWDDLMHEIFVRQTIEASLADSRAGRTRDVDDVRCNYGLTE